VQFLKGVGPQRAALLERMGIRLARDLLFFFPRTYEDLSQVARVSDLQEGDVVSVCGDIEETEFRQTGPGRSVFGILIRDGDQFLRAVWFNQDFMQQRFSRGQRIMLSGQAKRQTTTWQMTHPKVKNLDVGENDPGGQVLPVYPLTEGLNQNQIRRIVSAAVDALADEVDEVLPDELRGADILGIADAIRDVHRPPTMERAELARRRFIYQELLVLQLALAMRRKSLQENDAPKLEINAKIDARIRRRFPFELTPDQQQVIGEIRADLALDRPMNRLLQGDVGAGKTVVAEYAMLGAIAVGYQAVIMAPTDVLAQQHMRTLERDLAESRVRLALLTGSLTQSERKATLDKIAGGEVDIVVATHAITHAARKEASPFHRLGLVVIDEQHKFGVKQRAELKQAGLNAHYLVMTATPIPRTISISLFGDLDVSSLRSAPPGRQEVHTYVGEEDKRDQWWDFYRKKLLEGRQGYVIAPLVAQSEQVDAANVEEAFEELASDRLESFRVDLVHGRMSSAEKEAAMSRFRNGETQVLVATSVVEVGVDVANATLMTIEDAGRFGLAQLHQLRGRISRGAHPGYLCVFAELASEETKKRLRAFADTTDGFALAELDFQMRGPGDIFGTKQHGLPPFRIADLQRDDDVLEEARERARQLIDAHTAEGPPSWERLHQMVLARFGSVLELGDVG
jgi:ATP-dependent DNA helicase RecG